MKYFQLFCKSSFFVGHFNKSKSLNEVLELMFCSARACVRSSRRFLKALSFASLDKEDLLSPINHSTLQRSSSLRSMVSSATYGCSEDYIGLALPLDINHMFQVCFVLCTFINVYVEYIDVYANLIKFS